MSIIKLRTTLAYILLRRIQLGNVAMEALKIRMLMAEAITDQEMMQVMFTPHEDPTTEKQITTYSAV